MKTGALLAAIALAVAGCVDTSGSNPTSTAAATNAPRPVRTARAVQMFDAVCGGSLANDFASAQSLMAKNGVTVPSPMGTPTMYSTTEDLSFQIQKGPGLGNTCSMVWGTTEAKSAVADSLSKIGSFKPSPLGIAAMYHGQKRLVLLRDGYQKLGSTTYYNLKLLSDH